MGKGLWKHGEAGEKHLAKANGEKGASSMDVARGQ